MMSLLDRAYDRVSTLHQFLLSMNHSKAVFTKSDDCSSYKTWLECVFVCGKSLDPDTEFNPTHESYLQDIVDSVKKRFLLVQKNDVILGRTSEAEGSGNLQLTSLPGFSKTVINSVATKSLLTKHWQTLHSRVGDDFIYFIFTRTSVFLKQPNDCFLQLTGLPVNEIWKNRNDDAFRTTTGPRCYSRALTKVEKKLMQRRKKREEKKKQNRNPSRTNPVTDECRDRFVPSGMHSRELNTPYLKCLPVQRGFVLHNLSEYQGLPKNFILQRVCHGRDGCLELLKAILKTCVHNEKDEQLQNKHLEEAITPSAISVLDRLVTKFKKCPWRTLLSQHCPSSASNTIEHAAHKPEVRKSVQIFYRKPQAQSDQPKKLCPARARYEHGLRKRSIPSSFEEPREKVFKHISNVPSTSTIPTDENKTVSTAQFGCVNNGYVTAARNPSILDKSLSFNQVYSFVHAVILRTIPLALFGSKANRNQYLRSIDKFIRIGYGQTVYLGDLMHNIKVEVINWLPEGLEHDDKQVIVAKFLLWIAQSYVKTIITSWFYVTDSAEYKTRLFYFHKKEWMIFQNESVQALVESQQLVNIKLWKAENLVSRKLSLGLSKLRILPKASGFRPITNHSYRNRYQKYSVRLQLLTVFHILTHLKIMHPSLVGSSTVGHNQIHKKWSSFIASRSGIRDTRPLYFISADIRKSFDNIKITKLQNIVAKALGSLNAPLMILRRYKTFILCASRSHSFTNWRVSTVQNYEAKFTRFIKNEIERKKHSHAIMQDTAGTLTEKASIVLDKLKAHLEGNILRIGRKYYLQQSGISHGSILSTLLCDFFYGRMEHKYFHMEENELLMRHVDDFLLVTPCKERAEKFLNMFIRGFPDYGCEVNPSKTCASFKVNHLPDVTHVPYPDLFPWCGVLFNTKTLETSLQYERYVGVVLRDTMKWNAWNPNFAYFEQKLKWALQCSNRRLLLDGKINSEKMQVRNIYLMLLMTAFRFHCCVSGMHSSFRINSNLFAFIEKLPYWLKKKNEHVFRKAGMKILHKKKSWKWLSLTAFTTKLKLHRDRYHVLLKVMSQSQQHLEKSMKPIDAQLLSEWIGPKMPPAFHLIL